MTLDETFTLCGDDAWPTPRWYHRELLAWARNSAPRSLIQHDADFGKAPRWRTLSTAPDWPNDFLARVRKTWERSGDGRTWVVMDDLGEVVRREVSTMYTIEDDRVTSVSVADLHTLVEPLRARVSVETLMLFELPTEQGHRYRRTQ